MNMTNEDVEKWLSDNGAEWLMEHDDAGRSTKHTLRREGGTANEAVEIVVTDSDAGSKDVLAIQAKLVRMFVEKFGTKLS